MAVNVGRIQAVLELKNRMSAQLKAATKDMDRFQSKMDKMGQAATRLGGAMTAGITVPLVAIAATSVKAFAEFEHTMSAVKAVTGAVGEDFGKLERLALKMGETTVFTASQSAEAMKAFGLAGFTTNEILSALGPTLNLAAAGSMDMGTAASIAAKVTRGYGIAAEDTTQAMDVLTKAFTTSNTNLVELGSAFRMVGPIARTAGLSFEMTTAALQIMADAGISGSMGGRQLRRALLQLVDPAGDAAKTLKRLGVETVTAGGRLLPFDNILDQIAPHLQDTAAMAEIFGTIAMPGMVAILEKGTTSLREMTKALEDSEGTGTRIADVMLDNLTGAWTLFTSAVEGVQNAIGKELEPVLRVLIDAFTKMMMFVSGTMLPGFNKLTPAIKFIVVALLAAAAAAGPLILAFGLLVPALPAIVSAFGAVTAALSLAGFAWAALAAVVVVWIARNENARKFAVALGKVLLGLARVVGKVLTFALNFAANLVGALLDRLFELMNFVTFGLGGKALGLLTKGLDITGTAMMTFGTKTDEVIDKAEDLRKAVKQLLSGDASMAALNNAWWQLTRTGHGTEEMFEDIAGQALALHQVAGKELTPGLKKLVDRFGLLEGAVAGANEPIEKTLENWEKLAKKWKEGAIPQANDMARALAAIGGTSSLTRKEMDEINTTLDAAIVKYGLLGEAVPQAVMDGWLATIRDVQTISLPPLQLSVPPMPEAMTAAGWGFIGDWLVPPIENAKASIHAALSLALQPPPALVFSFGRNLGQWLSQGFSGIVKGLPNTVIDAFKGGGGLFGALKAIGAQAGSVIGGSLGASFGAMVKAGEGAGKIMKGIAGMAGPIGAAIGALAGPLIGFIGKLFSGSSVQESVTKTAKRWGVSMSEGLAEAIAKTRETVSSDIGAMMLHVADIIREGGGVAGMGFEKALSKVRDLFVMIETGQMSAKRIGPVFDESFKMLADAAIASGEIVGKEFLELISLADRFGVKSGEVMAFIGEQTTLASVGMAALFGPTIADAHALNTKVDEQREKFSELTTGVEKQREKLAELKEGTDDYNEATALLNQLLTDEEAAQANLNKLLTEQQDLATKSKDELADLGIVAVGAFEAALASGMSFTDAVKATAPALNSVIEAQKALGITSENVALQALTSFQTRISENEALVTGVEALDDTMLALSRTGALNEETLAAMERQGLRMFEKLIAAGFTENESLMMMAESVGLMMSAHEKLGIPIDENTQKLITQMKEAGVLESKQKTGWAAVEGAINKVVSKLDELINRILGVKTGIDNIPKNVEVNVRLNAQRVGGGWSDEQEEGGQHYQQARHGLVGDFGSGTPVMLHGREAIVPLDGPSGGQGSGDDLLSEVRGLRQELRLLPLHLRDAILLAQ